MKIIIFNSSNKKFISTNVIHIDINDKVIDKNTAYIVDRQNRIQYAGNKISDIVRECMGGLGCTLRKHW